MKAMERADYCLSAMKALHESVEKYEDAAQGLAGTPGGIKFNVMAGYETPKNSQANKTAIRRQITSLRQSLLALEGEI